MSTSKEAERLAKTNELRDDVNAYRAARDGASTEPAPARPPRRPPPAWQLTVLPDYPLNPNPPSQIPEYTSMGQVAAIAQRQAQRRLGARRPIKPVGGPELRKRGSA
jgi:hypothetical protein